MSRTLFPALGLSVALWIGSTPALAQSGNVPSAGACVLGEIIDTLPQLFIHKRFETGVVSKVQLAVRPAVIMSPYVDKLDEALGEHVDAGAEGRWNEFRYQAGKFATMHFDKCYRARLDRIRPFLKSIDTSKPKISDLYPTLWDWSLGDRPCQAMYTLQLGMEKLSEWMDNVEANIRTLRSTDRDLDHLWQGLHDGAEGLLQVSDFIIQNRLDGFGRYGTQFGVVGAHLFDMATELRSQIAPIGKTKIIQSERVLRDLGIEYEKFQGWELDARLTLDGHECDDPNRSANKGSHMDVDCTGLSRARCRLKQLRAKQREKSDAQWKDVSDSMRASGSRLRNRAETAFTGFTVESDQLYREMLEATRDIMTSEMKRIMEHNRRTLQSGGASANCAQSEEKVRRLRQWINEANLHRQSGGGSRIDPGIRQVQQHINEEMAVGRPKGCRYN